MLVSVKLFNQFSVFLTFSEWVSILLFSCVDHPLSMMVQKYQHKLCRNLLKLTQNRLHELKDVTIPLEMSPTPPTNQHKNSSHSLSKQHSNLLSKIPQKKSNTNISDKTQDKFIDDEIKISDSTPGESLSEAIVETKVQLRKAYAAGKEIESQLMQEKQQAIENSKIDTDLKSDSETSEDESDISELSLLKIEDNEETRVEQLTNEAYKRHLQNFTKDILLYMERLVKTFTMAYEELGSAEGRDQCYAYIEEKFFRPVWPHLILLYRSVVQVTNTSTYQWLKIRIQSWKVLSSCHFLNWFKISYLNYKPYFL